MKTRKQILVASLIAISLITNLTAQAGLIDWLSGSSAKADEAANGSFDQLYAAVTGSAPIGVDEAVVIANSVVGMNTPSTGIQRATHRMYTVEVSGYTSEVAQTDDSPFITAQGTHVRDGVVASNMFPFGTLIKIPSLYGNKIFVVEDRMNRRFQRNVDIWFAEKADALKLGRRLVKIEVIQ